MLKPIYALILTIVLSAAVVAWRLSTGSLDETLIERHFESVDSLARVESQAKQEVPKSIEEYLVKGSAQGAIDVIGWSEVPEAPTHLGSYLADLENQSFLKLNRAKLEGLQVDDTIELWIPQEAELMEFSVSKLVITSSGNRVINGTLDGDENYPFVITIGKTSTFATISTRNAVYSLQGDAKVAWIASSAALKQHFPQREIDYIVPNNS
jgi:hypothetical protein